MGPRAGGHRAGRTGPRRWPEGAMGLAAWGRQHIVAYAINELQLGDGFRAVCGQSPVIWPFARRSVWGPIGGRRTCQVWSFELQFARGLDKFPARAPDS